MRGAKDLPASLADKILLNLRPPTCRLPPITLTSAFCIVCTPRPNPEVIYINGNRDDLTLLTLIQLSLRSFPIHRWITQFATGHVELNLNMFSNAMFFLCWLFCNLHENKSSVAKSVKLQMVSFSV